MTSLVLNNWALVSMFHFWIWNNQNLTIWSQQVWSHVITYGIWYYKIALSDNSYLNDRNKLLIAKLLKQDVWRQTSIFIPSTVCPHSPFPLPSYIRIVVLSADSLLLKSIAPDKREHLHNMFLISPQNIWVLIRSVQKWTLLILFGWKKAPDLELWKNKAKKLSAKSTVIFNQLQLYCRPLDGGISQLQIVFICSYFCKVLLFLLSLNLYRVPWDSFPKSWISL